MATITRTIPDAVVPRVFAAFNSVYRKDLSVANLTHFDTCLDNYIKGIVAQYESQQAAATADTQARADITIS